MAAVGGNSSSNPISSTDDKPVVVRVKRKASQSPLDAFWLEINERPLKRPLLDFGNLSISDSPNKEELITKKVLVQHVQTISSAEANIDILQSFLEPAYVSKTEQKPKHEDRKDTYKRENKRQGQQLLKARQSEESSAKNARFEQIWKSRKGNKEEIYDKELHEMCHFYDVRRVDDVPFSVQEEISLEDQQLLSSYLPLLREYIPSAATELESDLTARVLEQDDYLYDYYTVKEEPCFEDSSFQLPLVQVDDEDFYDGPDESDYETDDSNAENHPFNEYPDEPSEDENNEDSEASDNSDNESDSVNEKSSVGEDSESEGFHDSGDPLYDDEIDDNYSVEEEDGDYQEEWKWSYR